MKRRSLFKKLVALTLAFPTFFSISRAAKPQPDRSKVPAVPAFPDRYPSDGKLVQGDRVTVKKPQHDTPILIAHFSPATCTLSWLVGNVDGTRRMYSMDVGLAEMSENGPSGEKLSTRRFDAHHVAQIHAVLDSFHEGLGSMTEWWLGNQEPAKGEKM